MTHRDLLAYAQAVGLDVKRFEADLEARTYESRIREDFLSGARSGVNGTPTFFINELRHNGSYDLETLLEALRASWAPPPAAGGPAPRGRGEGAPPARGGAFSRAVAAGARGGSPRCSHTG